MDSLGLSDSVLPYKTLIMLDHIGLSDAVVLHKPLLSIADSIILLDVVSTPCRFLRVLDCGGLADGVIVNKTLQITENASLVEVVETSMGGVKKPKLFLVLGDFTVQLSGD